jgi:hypothetical protein
MKGVEAQSEKHGDGKLILTDGVVEDSFAAV